LICDAGTRNLHQTSSLPAAALTRHALPRPSCFPPWCNRRTGVLRHYRFWECGGEWQHTPPTLHYEREEHSLAGGRTGRWRRVVDFSMGRAAIRALAYRQAPAHRTCTAPPRCHSRGDGSGRTCCGAAGGHAHAPHALHRAGGRCGRRGVVDGFCTTCCSSLYLLREALPSTTTLPAALHLFSRYRHCRWLAFSPTSSICLSIPPALLRPYLPLLPASCPLLLPPPPAVLLYLMLLPACWWAWFVTDVQCGGAWDAVLGVRLLHGRTWRSCAT